MFETVDFPVAIEPVRPIRSIFGGVFFRVRLGEEVREVRGGVDSGEKRG